MRPDPASASYPAPSWDKPLAVLVCFSPRGGVQTAAKSTYVLSRDSSGVEKSRRCNNQIADSRPGTETTFYHLGNEVSG
jgi:hypothetical protein